MSPIKRIVMSAAVGAMPVLSLGCFTTLAIYSGNTAEFSMSFIDLLRFYLPYLLAAVGVCGLAGATLPATALLRYHSILAALAVLIWLQGNILVWDYGVLDGREIDWLAGAWRGVLDLAIWIAVLGVAAFAYKRVGKLLVTAATAAVAIQLVGAVFTVSGRPDASTSRPDIQASEESRAAIAQFSSQKNVLHIVMDGFQTDIFEAIVADPASRITDQDLRGFTLFRNHVGLYPYTQLTVPAILTGKQYRNQIPVADFIERALAGETILSAAAMHGYEVDIAVPRFLMSSYAQTRYTHAFATVSNEHVSDADYVRTDAARLLDLALFRVVPHFAKALVHRDELWVFQALAQPEAYLQMKYFSDLKFLENVADTMSIDREAPVYKLMHVMLSHQPTVGSERCEYDGRHSTNRTTVTNQARCGLWQVLRILRQMQELGIYDDSLIVLMADHGAWVPIEPAEGFAGSDASPLTAAMALPVLAIKPPNAGAAYSVSEAPTMITDVAATIAAMSGLNGQFPGESAFEIDPDRIRQRQHLSYGYGINPESEGYLFPMQEYEISGSPYDGAAWKKGQRYLPGGAIDVHE